MMNVKDLADQTHMDVKTIYKLARRDDDPLPLRTMIGNKRSSLIAVAEWNEWWGRNSVPFGEVKHT